MQKTQKSYTFTTSTINGFRYVLSDKNFRKKLEERDLLTDFDVLFVTMDYMVKTGTPVKMNKEEADSFMELTKALESARYEESTVASLGSMENFARLVHAQSMLLINLEERGELLKGLNPTIRKDKKTCERLYEEYENHWAILAARVLKNYYDFASTRDGVRTAGVTEKQYIDSEKSTIIGATDITKILTKLYKHKSSRSAVINNLPTREADFKRELPKVVKENQHVIAPITAAIYDEMLYDITRGRTYEKFTGQEPYATIASTPAPSKGKRWGAAAMAAAVLASHLAGPATLIAQEFGKEKAPVVNTQPDEQTPPVEEPQDEWGDSAIIVDDPEIIPDNPAEETEKPADNVVSPVPDDNDPENDTVVPDLQPDDNTNVFDPIVPGEGDTKPENPEQKPEDEFVQDPGYDQPNFPVPDENTSNNDKLETEGPVEERPDNFWEMS